MPVVSDAHQPLEPVLPAHLGPRLSPALTPRDSCNRCSYPDLVSLHISFASFPEACLPAFFLTFNKYFLSTNKTPGSALEEQDAHLHRQS